MTDLRLLEMKDRKPMAFGVKEIVGTLVTGGILFMVGLYAYSKVGASIDQTSFSVAENTTMTNVRDNITSGFDLGSVVFIVLAASVIIGVIMIAFR